MQFFINNLDGALTHVSLVLVLGGPASIRELDFMILMGPFQLEIFYNSLSLPACQ